jgi:Protein of unknown function (DUF2800)
LSDHSVLSPSSAHRWLFCTGSPAACKGLPDSTSVDSARGTLKHDIAQRCLTSNADPKAYLDTVHEVDGFTFTFDKEMVEEVASYVNAMRGELGKRLVEVRLDSSDVLGVDGQGGTADAVILDKNTKQCDVHDAKFGYILVSAKGGVEFGKREDGTPLTGNPQGLIYLGSAVKNFDVLADWERGSFTIHQPSRDHTERAEYSRAEIEQFVEWAKPRAQEAWRMYNGEIPIVLTPGKEQCEWCPIRGSCSARADSYIAMFPLDKETVEAEPQMFELSDADIAATISIAEGAIAWGNDVLAEASKRAKLGAKLPGFKLVKGKKGARFWKSKEAALAALSMLVEDDTILFTPGELKSPTQIEELIGAYYSSVKPFVDQSEGSLHLVPTSARGAEVLVTPAEFEPSQENSK